MESYLIQSNLALFLFYLLSRVVIIRESNQQMKRFMGLCIAIFCASYLLVPTFDFGSSKDYPAAFQQAIQSASDLQTDLTISAEKGWNTWMIVYFAGVFIFSIRFLAGLIGIARLYLQSRKSKKWGFVLVESEAEISPFSFFNYLFIKKGDAEKSGLAPIILHEKYHKDQMHSVDAMLLEILTILFWFNPVIWLIQRDVKAAHEFLADDYVISIKGYDKLAYQDLLFKARTGISFKSVNYLSNQTSLKQRFNMMEKRKTHSKTSFIRAGIVLAAMATALFLTSFSTLPNILNEDQPDIRFFTASGEVDLEKGISKDTDRLFIRMMPEEGSTMAYRLSKVEATLVTGGLGQWTMKSSEMFDFGTKLSEQDKKSALVVEVKEYMTKDENDVVETVALEKSIFFNFPVY